MSHPARPAAAGPDPAQGTLVLLVAVEEVDEGVVERQMLVNHQRPQILVGIQLAQQFVGTPAEEVNPAAHHQLEQPLVALDLLYLEAGGAQYVGVLPAAALAMDELLQIAEGAHSGHGLLLLGADEADAIAKDAEIHREADIVEVVAPLRAREAVDGQQVGVEVVLQYLAQPGPAHGRGRAQFIVAEAVTGLLQRQLQQLLAVEGT